MKTIQLIICILITSVIIFALVKVYLRRKKQGLRQVEVLTFSNTQLYEQCSDKTKDADISRFFYEGKHFTNRALHPEQDSYFDAKVVFIGVVDETKITSDTIAAFALSIQASEALDINFQEHDGDYMLGRCVD